MVEALRIGDVILQNAPHGKPLAQLEAEHRIFDLTRLNPLDVGFGRMTVGVLRVECKPPPGKNAPQIQIAAELPPRFVEGRTNALPLPVRIDIHIGPVEGVALRIVIVEVAAIGDPGVGVRPVGIAPARHDQRRHCADHFAPDLRDDLPLRKQFEVVVQLPLAPDDILLHHERKGPFVYLDQPGRSPGSTCRR